MLAILAALLLLAIRVAAADELDDELDELELPEGLDLDDDAIDVEQLIDDSPIDADVLLPLPDRPHELRTRSPFGRVDLSLGWRRIDPITSARRDELWLLGTWRL